jgi:hypothetical protein
MRKLILNFIVSVIAINSMFIQTAMADSENQQASVASMIKIRDELVIADQQLEQMGYVSRTTLVGLAMTVAGIGIFATASKGLNSAKMTYDVVAAGQKTGATIAASSSVLNSIIQQTKQLMGSDQRSDINFKTKNLITLLDTALLSRELSFSDQQKVIELRSKFVEKSQKLSKNPWYVQSLNFVEGAVTLISILAAATTLITGNPMGLAAAGIVMVPLSAVTNVLRALDEVHTMHSHRKFIKESIQFLNIAIEASQNKSILLTP